MHGPRIVTGAPTRRETEVLTRIAQGKTSKEVACELGIAPKTVECHRDNAMRKLGLNGIADVTRYAVEHNLIQVARPLTLAQMGTALCEALGVDSYIVPPSKFKVLYARRLNNWLKSLRGLCARRSGSDGGKTSAGPS